MAMNPSRLPIFAGNPFPSFRRTTISREASKPRRRSIAPRLAISLVFTSLGAHAIRQGMADIFISYRSLRRNAAEHLADILREYGYTVWWDYHLPSGRDFSVTIDNELKAAKAVIVLWCSLSVESEWVREEASKAKKAKKNIPVFIERVELPIGFSLDQTLDLTDWDGGPMSPALETLLREVAKVVQREVRPNTNSLQSMDRMWRRGTPTRLAEFALVRNRPDVQAAVSHSQPAATTVASASHADLRASWLSFPYKSDPAAVGKLLAKAELAGAHGLAVEIETHLDRLRADAAAKVEAERLRPGREFRDGDGPLMVVIPAGEFMIGSPPDEKERSGDEGPHHLVRIAKPFAVSKYPITVGEWKSFIAATGHAMGDSAYVFDGNAWKDTQGRGWTNPGFPQDDRHPVTCVNWQDAAAYAAWLANKTGHTYRLLSEAEWEYSCRAGTDTPFYFGRTITPDQANYDGNYAYDGGSKGAFKKGTTPVGSYPANAFGLHDCHGNVWEWVQDCWNENYNGAPTDGTAWATGDCNRRVVRGGSWVNDPRDLRSAFRVGGDGSDRVKYLGFRLARTF
jgi:formylglycine-generating enzyme required for sulfatase activity